MAITQVTGSMVATNAIAGTIIADNAITAVHIATNAISGTLVADNSITAVHVAGSSITATQMQDNAIGTGQLAGIARGKIIYGDSSGDPQLLALGSNGQVLKSDGSDITWGSISQPITALNNATENELLTVGATNTELEAESGLTWDTSTLTVTGTANVSTQLNVVGTDAAFSGTKLVSGSYSAAMAGLSILNANDGTGYLLFGDGASAAGYIGQISYAHATNHMSLVTNGSERIRILSSGRVGIGDTTPEATLEVKTTGADYSLKITNDQNVSGSYNGLSIAGYDENTGSYPLVIVGNSLDHETGGNPKFCVRADGKVGIGINAPENKLHVHQAGANDVGITISNGNYDWTLGIDTSGSDSFTLSRHTGLGNYDLLKINPTTYGTIVQGDIHINAYANQMTKGLFFYNDSHLLSGIRNKSHASYNDSGGLEFLTSGTSNAAESVKMFLNSQGNLGIGTADAITDPITTLHVASGSPARAMIHMDADTAGGEAQLLFKADSTGPGSLGDDRIKAGIIFRRDDPGTRGTGDLHFCNEGNNSDVNVSSSHKRFSIRANTVCDFHNVYAEGATPVVSTAVMAPGFQVGNHASSGMLGIWRTNTMEFNYYHNGIGYVMTFTSTGTMSGDFVDTSDVNLKENISSITDGTTVIKALRPVKFDWKNPNKENNQHGFIAQEVETALPTAVQGNDYVENATGHPDDEPADNGKTINSKAVLAHAVKAIQELEARIATLEG